MKVMPTRRWMARSSLRICWRILRSSADSGLKQAIDAGYATGPRIVPAGYALGATGGHCDSTYLPPSLEKKDGKEEGIGDTPDEPRYQVRRQRKYGAEVIKVCATGDRKSTRLNSSH